MSAVTSPPTPPRPTPDHRYVFICDQIVSINFTVLTTNCGSPGAYFCAAYSSNGLLGFYWN